jgi:MFS transporter, DHA1 family, multidrug resistance protein
MATQLAKNSALSALLQVSRGKVPNYSRTGVNVKDIETTSVDGTITPPPEVEKDEQPSEREEIVTWNGKDDPDNPQNWPIAHKMWVTILLSVYTFAIYVGSSIYTPAQPYVQEQFHVGNTAGSLGLALYVLGYGVGCLLFSPLSEIPAIGRNPPYAISGFLFVILCIPTSLVENYAGLMVLRFLLGFMGSPCLATAAASLADVWTPPQMPFAIAIWSVVASGSPAVGPTLSAYAIEALDWHWHSWILLMLAGPVVALMICTMPETSPETILYYRAKRLRQEGHKNATSAAEQKQKNMSTNDMIMFYMVKPFELNAKDPAILFTTIYLGLLYGIFYSYFESLPLVYPVFYNFPATSVALVFLAVILGALVAFCLQIVYLMKAVFPRLQAGTFGELENFLLGGVVTGPLVTVGLFVSLPHIGNTYPWKKKYPARQC